jgi:hypothetical protein
VNICGGLLRLSIVYTDDEPLRLSSRGRARDPEETHLGPEGYGKTWRSAIVKMLSSRRRRTVTRRFRPEFGHAALDR